MNNNDKTVTYKELSLEEILALAERVRNWDELNKWGDFTSRGNTRCNEKFYCGVIDLGEDTIGAIAIEVGISGHYYGTGKIENIRYYVIGAESIGVIDYPSLGYYKVSPKSKEEICRGYLEKIKELYEKARKRSRSSGHTQLEGEKEKFYEKTREKNRKILLEKARTILNN